MSARIGVELGKERIRAVTVDRWSRSPRETFEIQWDPRAPRDAVALLRKQLGEVSAIGMAIDVGFLHAKNVKLPPVSPAERRGILTLEPDRFFALDRGDIVVAVGENSDLVFAADSSAIGSWLAAFEEWGSVSTVEPSPRSAARGVSIAGARSGTFELTSTNGERSVIEIGNGDVLAARRNQGGASSESLRALPTVRGLAKEFLIPYSAALGADAPLYEMLLPPGAMSRIQSRRRNAFVRAVINFALALAFAVAALDRSRTRVLEHAQQEIAALSPRVEGPASVQARLAQLDLESSAVHAAGALHADPVSVLAAISRRLPHDAVVMSIRADGDEWQIDGTARDASSIVPALDADPSLENVRFLSASSHFTEGTRTYETFSVALHAGR